MSINLCLFLVLERKSFYCVFSAHVGNLASQSVSRRPTSWGKMSAVLQTVQSQQELQLNLGLMHGTYSIVSRDRRMPTRGIAPIRFTSAHNYVFICYFVTGTCLFVLKFEPVATRSWAKTMLLRILSAQLSPSSVHVRSIVVWKSRRSYWKNIDTSFVPR